MLNFLTSHFPVSSHFFCNSFFFLTFSFSSYSFSPVFAFSPFFLSCFLCSCFLWLKKTIFKMNVIYIIPLIFISGGHTHPILTWRNYRVSQIKLDLVNGSKLQFGGRISENLRRMNHFEKFNKASRNFFCRKC